MNGTISLALPIGGIGAVGIGLMGTSHGSNREEQCAGQLNRTVDIIHEYLAARRRRPTDARSVIGHKLQAENGVGSPTRFHYRAS